jgi:hypothetical protein
MAKTWKDWLNEDVSFTPKPLPVMVVTNEAPPKVKEKFRATGKHWLAAIFWLVVFFPIGLFMIAAIFYRSMFD